MNVGDRVKGSYGYGEILSIVGDVVTVKFDKEQIPVQVSIHYLKKVYNFAKEQVVKFKNGVIGIVVDVNNNKATIEPLLNFNMPSLLYDVDQKDVEFLEKISSDNLVFDDYKYEVGKEVIHDIFGVGTIKALYSKYALVQYKNGYRLIDYAKIEPSDSTINEEFEEKENESAYFRIIPSNYSESEYYSTSAKKILTWSRKNLDVGFACTQSYTDDKKNTLGIIVEKNKGVIIFKIIEGINNENFDIAIDLLNFTYNDEKNLFKNKFLNSKVLCNYSKDGLNKILKFPLKFVYVLPNLEYNDLNICQRKKLNEYKYVYARRFKSGNRLFSDFEEYDPNFESINQKLYSNILERVVPENCTMLLEKEKNKELDIQKDESSVKMVPISNKDQEFIALSLDDDEIRFINNTKPGHWLTLANPGTGKSVILLSKAYRLVSMNPESKVLITCYNDNLCTHHTIFKERTGLNAHGLYVKKFFKMVFDLLKDYKIPTIGLETLKNNENKYDLAIKYLYDYVSEPEYKPVFDAIFIDEVQLFKPIWILTLKLMLKKDGYFELYGDLNQNVRTSNNGLKTPWKDKSLNLNWQGHTRYLTKNYRNTQNINNYLNKLIEKINNNVKKYKPDYELDDTKLASISSRNNKRRVYIPRCDEAGMPKKVIHMIEEAHEKWHASYDDIAIIFPVSHYDNYQPFEKIKKLLENKGIENCQIFGEKDVKSRLNDTNGIIFSTIESSLGLDFNIVIVCGTAYWKNYWTKSSYKPQILTQEKLESGDNDAITAYCDYGRKLYSACSRARNGLIIVDDLPNDSPMRLLIKKEVE